MARTRTQFTVRPQLDPPTPRREGGLWGGAAEVDITPPPGLPRAGYSANAHDGRGFHTRLRARVLYLDDGVTAVAWVACDLLGGSSVLHHRVAEAVAPHTRVRLPGLVIGATHTHAGPGQFLGTDFYNRFASNRSGFDPAWTDFLVEQIAGAVIDAATSAVPAQAAIGSIDVWGATRNRSHPAHVTNATVSDKRTEPQRKWSAVNPQLHLVRLDALDATPIAAMAVFSVHGTGVPVSSHQYNADVWAYLVGELSQRIETASGRRAIVGAVQGTHADVAPALRPGMAGHVEARRIGREIGARAHQLWSELGTDLAATIPLAAGLREVDLHESRTIDGITLPKRPAVGAALVAGATENSTPILDRLPPFTPGHPKRWGRRGEQGAKWVLGTRWGQPLIVPPKSFPFIVPVQVIGIGSTVFAHLPFEITVESGRRIAAGLAESTADHGIERTVVCSVANEYFGYVTTPEEYSQQWYEGGHTLYGPNTQPFLTAHVTDVATRTFPDGYADVAAERRWDLRVQQFWPTPDPGAADTPRHAPTAPHFTDPAPNRDGFWELTWTDAEPARLDWHRPLVRVDRSDDGGTTWAPAVLDGRPVDDQGWDIEVTHEGPLRAVPGAHRYTVRWYNPDVRAGRCHRFVLLANAKRAELITSTFD